VQAAASAVPALPAARPGANATPLAPATVAQAEPEPDVVPDAPPPPPFDLPKPPAPKVASVPLPIPAPAPAPRPAPAPVSVPAPRPAPQPMPAPVAQPAPLPEPASRPALASAGTAAGTASAGTAAGAGSAIAVIYFGDGKAALDNEARHVLTQVADIYRLHGGTLRVVGYSGGPARGGDAIHNSVTALTLASARADAVADGLESLGLQHDRIERTASGDAAPMIDEGRNTGVAGTRRAEIWLDY
jgi:outer membrane protein OmpA-like peptidoglycan-associated protein